MEDGIPEGLNFENYKRLEGKKRQNSRGVVRILMEFQGMEEINTWKLQGLVKVLMEFQRGTVSENRYPQQGGGGGTDYFWKNPTGD